jgi:hypothetical protein
MNAPTAEDEENEIVDEEDDNDDLMDVNSR